MICDCCGRDVEENAETGYSASGICPDCRDAGWIETADGDVVNELEDDRPRRRLTRQERLQELADRGTDTWPEFYDER